MLETGAGALDIALKLGFKLELGFDLGIVLE